MDPLDCDGEANARPISPSTPLALIPAADAIGSGLVRDVDDVAALPGHPSIWFGSGSPPAVSGEDFLRGLLDVPGDRAEGWADDCEGDCPGPRVSKSGFVAIIVQANARAARGDLGDCDGDTHLCSLCSVSIPPTADRVVWTWTPEGERHPITLHAHRGCDAIRREIDLGEWTQGDLLDRLVEWADDDPLNHDLRELDANLSPEQRADMGGEIIAAAIRALDDQTDACPGCPSCQPVPCEGEGPFVRFILETGACADCGGVVRTVEEARRHVDGHACAERNEAEQEPTITVVWHCDGSGRVPRVRE